jgi:hypothetical protein
MSNNKKFYHLQREFLNPLGVSGNAYISSGIKQYKDSGDIYGEIEITDCQNKINLHYELKYVVDKANALYKLDQLIHVLMNHRNALNKIEVVERKPRVQRKKAKTEIEPPVA